MLADKIINFNLNLQYQGDLPKGFTVLNPYLDNPETLQVMSEFYQKYYNDNNPRKFLIGINPGRHGAGVTGIPFTDTKRLRSECGITMQSAHTHEISSVFMYEMITQYGGTTKFYSDIYINSLFPLAIIRQNHKGDWINANYYDDTELFHCVKDFMIYSLQQHINLGLVTDEVFILGKKNLDFLQKINKQTRFFKKMTALEHPRYIQQYQSKNKQQYIDKYIQILQN